MLQTSKISIVFINKFFCFGCEANDEKIVLQDTIKLLGYLYEFGVACY